MEIFAQPQPCRTHLRQNMARHNLASQNSASQNWARHNIAYRARLLGSYRGFMPVIHRCWWLLSGLLVASSALAEERRFDKTFAVTPGGTLTVGTDIGSVTVSGSDANQVVVHAVVSGDRSFVERFEITTDSTSEGVSVRGERHDNSGADLSWLFGVSLEVRYTIQVPRDYHEQVRNSRGDLELRNFNGKAYGTTSRGDVLIDGINGEVQIDTSRGNVRGTQLTGNVRVVTSRGNVNLTKIVGPLEVRTSRGHVQVALTNPNRGTDLLTSRGNVSITLPKLFAADLDARTSRGDLDCDLPVTSKNMASNKRSVSNRRQQALNGTLNGGGKPLKVHTSRGNIDIRSDS